MKIIVGLGNPGYRYKNTRHNAGFMVLDELAAKHRIRIKNKGFQGLYGTGRIAGHEAVLFKPLTFMNLSGEAVKALCSSRMDEEADLLVISDDFNLPDGAIRLRAKGSSGGHNGLESIIGKLGPDFARLRVGIGSSEMPENKATYVLAPFFRRDKGKWQQVVLKAAECAELWVEKGTEEAMRRCNGPV